MTTLFAPLAEKALFVRWRLFYQSQAESNRQKPETETPAGPPKNGKDSPLFDLYDHKAKFEFKGFTLAQLVDVAMQSIAEDELELRVSGGTQ